MKKIFLSLQGLSKELEAAVKESRGQKNATELQAPLDDESKSSVLLNFAAHRLFSLRKFIVTLQDTRI